MFPTPLTYTATTKSGQSFAVECRPEPKYLSTEYEAVAYVAGKKTRVFIGPEGKPAVELNAKLTKEVLGKDIAANAHASVALDRAYQQENDELARLANEAVQQQADELLNSLPRDTQVHPWMGVGSLGSYYYVRVAELNDTTERRQSTVQKIVADRLAKLVKKLNLPFGLSEGCESTFEAAPLLLSELLEKNASQELLANQQKAAETERRQQVAQQELFVWDADQIYSSAGNELLHSLGAIFSKEDQYIALYTTGYSRDIPNANTTYSLRDKLAQAGLTFDKESKQWRLPYSDEAATTVLALLKQYDSKAWPADLGMARCWECGRYSSRLDSDGYCGC